MSYYREWSNGYRLTGKVYICTSKGHSVNDYLLLNPEDYELVSDFDILDFTEFSDHAPVSFDLCICSDIFNGSLSRTHKYLRWDSDRNQEYIQLLSE